MIQHIDYLKRCIEISENAKKYGNTPFDALLVNGEGGIILEQENVEITEEICTGHAETSLVQRASQLYAKDYLANCTLYSTAEPYVMCQERFIGAISVRLFML